MAASPTAPGHTFEALSHTAGGACIDVQRQMGAHCMELGSTGGKADSPARTHTCGAAIRPPRAPYRPAGAPNTSGTTPTCCSMPSRSGLCQLSAILPLAMRKKCMTRHDKGRGEQNEARKSHFQFLLILAVASAASGCANAVPTAQPGSLSVTVLYPTSADSCQMGQNLKSIVRVQDEQENTMTQAEVAVSIMDPSGAVAGRQQAILGSGDLYRTATWNIPHRLQAGTWTIKVDARKGDRQGSTSSTFRVENSVGEDLLNKYGFWVDTPTLRGINPGLYKERGDAQDGVIVWGGLLPQLHVFVDDLLLPRSRQDVCHLHHGGLAAGRHRSARCPAGRL